MATKREFFKGHPLVCILGLGMDISKFFRLEAIWIKGWPLKIV